jgi:signal transduction histidine kinase
MNEVAARAQLAVLAALLLGALGLQVAAAAFGFVLPGSFWLVVLAVLAVTAAIAHVLLAPLRADLLAVRALVSADTQGVAQQVPEPRCAESIALFAALEQVHASVARLDAELTAARSEVEQAEQLRVRFVAAMGHDLRGPLNAIIGFSDMLVLKGLDEVTVEQRPSVDIIRRSAADLLVLLDAILEWAKTEAGQLQLAPATASLGEIIDEVSIEARKRSAGRGLRVQVSVAEDVPVLQLDRERVVQALLGLLDHATRAPERPRVTLSAWLARDESGRASVRIELCDPQLVVRPEDQSSFFEAFRASYAPSGKRVAGLGLGPSLARTLIRAHGGEVWFASQTDTGTTFVVDLPIPASQAPAA